jgi:hypothetical protein
VRTLQHGPQAQEARAALRQLKQLAKEVETAARRKPKARQP